MKPRLVSVKHAAQYLGVSVRTVRRLIEDGRLKVVRVRSLRLVPFNRIWNLSPTKVFHTEMRVAQVDLGKIAFEGLPGPRRKTTCLKDTKGRFVAKRDWPSLRGHMITDKESAFGDVVRRETGDLLRTVKVLNNDMFVGQHRA